ncbi:hypothetical protein T02_13482, partial [Trichinella nativa]
LDIEDGLQSFDSWPMGVRSTVGIESSASLVANLTLKGTMWTNRVEVQRKDDRARDSYVPERKAFELPLGTTVVARIFVHFERAVATCSASGVGEPEDVREGDRHQSTYLVAGRTNVWSIRT